MKLVSSSVPHGRQIFKRLINTATVINSSTVVESSPPSAENTTSLQDPILKPIGTPATTLLIQSPPSVSVYFKKNSLLSLYFPNYYTQSSPVTNTSINNLITSELKYFNFFGTLLSGRVPLAYQKVISTVPFNVLINNGNTRTFNTFYTLSLDGTADWAIFPKGSIHAFTGNTLMFKNKFIPTTISRKLSRSLNLKRSTKTGLSGSGNGYSYSFVSGRGDIALLGNGEIYELNLESNETILVNKSNLLGVQINGPDDLSNMIYFQDLIRKNASVAEQQATELESATDIPAESKLEQDQKQIEIANQTPTDKYLQVAKKAWLKSYGILKKSFFSFAKWLFNVRASNYSYVNIVGPTKVLIQAGSNPIKFPYLQNILANSADQSSKGSKALVSEKLPVKKEDILSYVTIKDGKAVFENTKDFKGNIEIVQQQH